MSRPAWIECNVLTRPEFIGTPVTITNLATFDINAATLTNERSVYTVNDFSSGNNNTDSSILLYPQPNFSALDTTTKHPFPENRWSGLLWPVAGLQWELIDTRNGQPQCHGERAKRLHPHRFRPRRNRCQPL